MHSIEDHPSNEQLTWGVSGEKSHKMGAFSIIWQGELGGQGEQLFIIFKKSVIFYQKKNDMIGIHETQSQTDQAFISWLLGGKFPNFSELQFSHQ